MTESPDNPTPDHLLMTIEVDENLDLVRWTASTPEGDEVEDWKVTGRALEAVKSHTWEITPETWLVVRDVLRYLNERDWEPETLM